MLDEIIKVLEQEEVIAYPTEAVYGLGCNPFSESAVKKILQLKKRNVSKGFILIAASWKQIKALTKPIPKEKLTYVLKTWPGSMTWLFPASDEAPSWIVGQYDTIALRVTAHPIARAICEKFGHPIVSTSANLENHSPAKTAEQVSRYFPSGIDLVISGEIGNLAKPTPIRDVMSGEFVRH